MLHYDNLTPGQRDVLRFWPEEGKGTITADTLMHLSGPRGERGRSADDNNLVLAQLILLGAARKEGAGAILTDLGHGLWGDVRAADEFHNAMCGTDSDGRDCYL